MTDSVSSGDSVTLIERLLEKADAGTTLYDGRAEDLMREAVERIAELELRESDRQSSESRGSGSASALEVEKTCPACGGSGVVEARNHDDPKWMRCLTCDGSGRLTSTTTAEPSPSPESPYGHDPFARGDLKPSRPESTDEEEERHGD